MATKKRASTEKSGGGKKQPNFLILWGDDIGQSNLSVFTTGMMAYRTPNIDRVANEGMLFTDYCAEQSCTGRASFITALHRHAAAAATVECGPLRMAARCGCHEKDG